MQSSINHALDLKRVLNSGDPQKLDEIFSAKYQEISGLIILCMKINNEDNKLSFLLDTGSPTILDVSIARKFKLTPYKSFNIIDAGGKVEMARTTKIDVLGIGPVKVNNLIPIVVDLKSALKNSELNLDGILGHTFLKHFIFTVDPLKRKIIFAPKGNRGKAHIASELARGGAIKLKLKQSKLSGSILMLETQVDEREKPSYFILDTGDNGLIAIPSKLAKIYGYSLQNDNVVAIRGNTGIGLSGKIFGGCYFKVTNIKLDGNDFGSCVFMASDLIVPGIGLGFLTNYRFTISFSKTFMILAPLKERINFDSFCPFGFAAVQEDGVLRVAQIISTSSADEEKLEIGDKIMAINGIKASKEGYLALMSQKNDENNNKVHLKIKSRSGNIRNITLKKKCLFNKEP